MCRLYSTEGKTMSKLKPLSKKKHRNSSKKLWATWQYFNLIFANKYRYVEVWDFPASNLGLWRSFINDIHKKWSLVGMKTLLRFQQKA